MRFLKPIRVIALPTVLLVVMTIVATISATLAYASTLTTVSSADLYASCLNTGQPGTNYIDAEVEPWVAVNPANSENIIGVWQQDRWSNGGAHGLLAGSSSDGGKTWSESTLPFSGCAPGAILDPFTGTPYNR